MHCMCMCRAPLIFAASSLLVALHCLRGLFGSAPPNGCTYSQARNDEQRCARTIDAACRRTTCNASCLASCISRSLRHPLPKACPAAPTSWRRSRATFNPCCRSKRRLTTYPAYPGEGAPERAASPGGARRRRRRRSVLDHHHRRKCAGAGGAGARARAIAWGGQYKGGAPSLGRHWLFMGFILGP